MASLRIHPKSRYWIACFTDKHGRRTTRSTKIRAEARLRKDAQAAADGFEEIARKRATEAQARRVIASIYERVTGDSLPSSTVAKFFTDWSEDLAGVEESTKKAYRQAATDFVEMLGERANLDLGQIGKRDFVAFLKLVQKRTTASTANKQLKYLRVAMNQAKRDGLIMTNPAADVPVLRVHEADGVSRRPFTLPELMKILDVCTAEWRGIVLFGFYTGQRLGDIVRLTWRNVDLASRELHFATRKTHRRMALPIAAPLMAHLEKMEAGDDPGAPLFPDAFEVASTQANVSSLSQAFHDILLAAGLVADERSKNRKNGDGEGRKRARKVNEITFHSLRHTATSLLKNAGVSEAVARDIIGHESEAISREYTHIEADVKRDALNKLPALGVKS